MSLSLLMTELVNWKTHYESGCFFGCKTEKTHLEQLSAKGTDSILDSVLSWMLVPSSGKPPPMVVAWLLAASALQYPILSHPELKRVPHFLRPQPSSLLLDWNNGPIFSQTLWLGNEMLCLQRWHHHALSGRRRALLHYSVRIVLPEKGSGRQKGKVPFCSQMGLPLSLHKAIFPMSLRSGFQMWNL